MYVHSTGSPKRQRSSSGEEEEIEEGEISISPPPMPLLYGEENDAPRREEEGEAPRPPAAPAALLPAAPLPAEERPYYDDLSDVTEDEFELGMLRCCCCCCCCCC
jgi:hypothetical protein